MSVCDPKETLASVRNGDAQSPRTMLAIRAAVRCGSDLDGDPFPVKLKEATRRGVRKVEL